MNKLGFDIDGTLSELWYEDTWRWFSKKMLINSGDYGIARKYVEHRLKNLKPLMIPKTPIFILTSRANWFRNVTEEWFKKYNIKYHYVFMPDELILDQQKQIERKAKIINKFEFNYYFEDEKDMREALTKLCPKCEILAPEKAIDMGYVV